MLPVDKHSPKISFLFFLCVSFRMVGAKNMHSSSGWAVSTRMRELVISEGEGVKRCKMYVNNEMETIVVRMTASIAGLERRTALSHQYLA